MAKAIYRNTDTNQEVWVTVGSFAGNPLWELVDGGGAGGGVTHAELDALEADTTGPHGIADFSLLETQDGATHKVEDGIVSHNGGGDPHGDRADATSKIATHAAATDPHADRVFTTSSITTHNADSTGVHGISDTQQLESITGSAGKVTAHAAASDPHGDRAFTTAAVSAHSSDSTAVHGIADTALLAIRGEQVINVGTVTSSAAPTPNADADQLFTVTALAEGAAFGAPSGTPVDGQLLIIRVLDNGTARSLAWNTIYRAIGVTLPTTTTVSKTMYVSARYNAADTQWDVLSVLEEA